MANKTKAITIRCDEALFDRLSAFSDVYGQSKTVIIERALIAYFNNVEKHGIVSAKGDSDE